MFMGVQIPPPTERVTFGETCAELHPLDNGLAQSSRRAGRQQYHAAGATRNSDVACRHRYQRRSRIRIL